MLYRLRQFLYPIVACTSGHAIKSQRRNLVEFIFHAVIGSLQQIASTSFH